MCPGRGRGVSAIFHVWRCLISMAYMAVPYLIYTCISVLVNSYMYKYPLIHVCLYLQCITAFFGIPGVHDLTCYHALCFPVAGSAMLLVFFYLFEYIQYMYTILTAGERVFPPTQALHLEAVCYPLLVSL